MKTITTIPDTLAEILPYGMFIPTDAWVALNGQETPEVTKEVQKYCSKIGIQFRSYGGDRGEFRVRIVDTSSYSVVRNNNDRFLYDLHYAGCVESIRISPRALDVLEARDGLVLPVGIPEKTCVVGHYEGIEICIDDSITGALWVFDAKKPEDFWGTSLPEKRRQECVAMLDKQSNNHPEINDSKEEFLDGLEGTVNVPGDFGIRYHLPIGIQSPPPNHVQALLHALPELGTPMDADHHDAFVLLFRSALRKDHSDETE